MIKHIKSAHLISLLCERVKQNYVVSSERDF